MHPTNHRYTWSQKRIVNNVVKTIRSQIDFILCTNSTKHFLQNSRAYSNTLTSSDHRLVLCEIAIEWTHIWKKPAPNKPKYAVSKLCLSTEAKAKYQQTLHNSLTTSNNQKPLQERWDNIKTAVKSAAESTVGLQE